MPEPEDIKTNEINVKLAGSVKLSTTYGEDKDPIYSMSLSVKAPSNVISRLMHLFESKVPVEVTFYSPQMSLMPDEGGEE